MLKELSIKNFAIIDDLHIRFSNGLTILSGETGAGKSIIINAVNLLLGARASTKLIRTGAQTAELEALFQCNPNSPILRSLESHGFTAAEELLIKRTVSKNDLNRIYINGSLATIGLLNELTENLASISGQHAHQGLLKEDQQLLLLDQFGGLLPLRSRLQVIYNEILPLIDTLAQFHQKQRRQTEQIELLTFQRAEILDAAVDPGEDAHLEAERSRLKNAETLYQMVNSGIEELYSSQGAVVERLTEIRKSIEKAAAIDPDLSKTAENLNDAVFALEDIVAGLGSHLKMIRFDEARLEEVEARLDRLQKLKRKYGKSLDGIVAYLASIEEELADTGNLAEKINQTAARLEAAHSEFSRLAVALSAKRMAAAETFARAVEQELAELKMAHTKFQPAFRTIAKSPTASPYLCVDNHLAGESGIDRVAFMFAPNVGEALKPLSAIASGGELSRIVLALKAILARMDSVETVVFDEVDAGIGGGVAEVVGKKLSSLARTHQIICITHLPQIAKFGRHHFKISKGVVKNRTRTTIVPLDDKGRVTEIARMLGGEKITRATLDHASEMLND